MTIRGVLLDFSGTLFRLEIDADWLSGQADDDRAAQLLTALTAPVLPIGAMPEHLRPQWHQRDLDQDIHRTIYLAVIRGVGLTDEQAVTAYDRLHSADNWRVYPDTKAMLERLRAASIPVAVVSNIAWDIRPTFVQAGLDGLVTEFLLSFEEGVVKPDAKIFRTACERLGVDPAEALMIGDNPEADGAAAAIGCAVEIVPPLPTDERPDALLRAVAAHGL